MHVKNVYKQTSYVTYLACLHVTEFCSVCVCVCVCVHLRSHTHIINQTGRSE